MCCQETRKNSFSYTVHTWSDRHVCSFSSWSWFIFFGSHHWNFLDKTYGYILDILWKAFSSGNSTNVVNGMRPDQITSEAEWDELCVKLILLHQAKPPLLKFKNTDLIICFNILVNRNVRSNLAIHLLDTPFVICQPIWRLCPLKRVYKPIHTPHWCGDCLESL